RMIDRVLQYAGDRAVVLGGDEQQSAGSRDLSLQPNDRFGLAGIVILVVERQVVDLELLEREVRRRERRHGLRQLPVERVAAKAAADYAVRIVCHLRLL